MTDWKELEHKYLMNTFKRSPLTLVRGEGARVWDDRGKEYLDFVGGWAVNVLGHAHPEIVNAVSEQARTLIQTSNQFYTVPQIRLAELLIENSCFDKVFFCNSGAEADEGAVKLARRYGRLYLDGAYEVITAMNSFHGRTLAMVAATGQPKFQEPYAPLPEGFINVEYDDMDAIKRAMGKKACAVMLEAIQGEGGVNIPDGNYLKEVRSWCDEQGILLILDEIQTGMGRTGTLFAYQHYGIEPDIMTLAKGLGGGVPIGALLAKEKASVFGPGDHGSTFGGNPLACAAGYATLKYILEHNVVENCRQVGNYLKVSLEGLKAKFENIVEVRGLGLLVAVELSSDIADDVVKACLDEGLLLNAVKPSALRFMPPLIIGESEVDEAMGILDGVLAKVSG
ncbi:MAG: acetylornithine aminotransferase [Dehalococcoidia bacterium DG_18]|nr:MAG: acetylornithine aminotransferase [Dehalococcoidia bacterium DG_18]